MIEASLQLGLHFEHSKFKISQWHKIYNLGMMFNPNGWKMLM